MLVTDDVVVLEGSQDADFIEGVLYLLFGQVSQLDLLKGIDFLVGESFHLVHGRVRSLS